MKTITQLYETISDNQDMITDLSFWVKPGYSVYLKDRNYRFIHPAMTTIIKQIDKIAAEFAKDPTSQFMKKQGSFYKMARAIQGWPDVYMMFERIFIDAVKPDIFFQDGTVQIIADVSGKITVKGIKLEGYKVPTKDKAQKLIDKGNGTWWTTEQFYRAESAKITKWQPNTKNGYTEMELVVQF